MRFTEFEKRMHDRGFSSLAEIARSLDTTPQAVSNWKSRDQVPMHIAAKIYNDISERSSDKDQVHYEDDSISISDILLTLAQQIKIIIAIIFIFAFSTFTYLQFIKPSFYLSQAKIVVPSLTENQSLGRFAGFASQFGVDIPTNQKADLSSPSLLPELIKSRKFFESIMNVKFYTKRYKKELNLIEILLDSEIEKPFSNLQISRAGNYFINQVVSFKSDQASQINILSVRAFEPEYARNLTQVILTELETLNRYYKSQAIREKTRFIETRISSVKIELELAEKKMKDFNENNRQISTPSLQLNYDRLQREVEIQKGIFLTLKQQLELAKIEIVQDASVFQILDAPQIPSSPINKKLFSKTALSILIGLFIGTVIAYIRGFLNYGNINERRKLRRVKNFIFKKTKEILTDRRISGLTSISLIIGLPFYLGHESSNPIYFGKYSLTLLIINILYILALLFFIYLFFFQSTKNKAEHNQ